MAGVSGASQISLAFNMEPTSAKPLSEVNLKMILKYFKMIHIKFSLKESECACTCAYILAENNNKMLEKEKAFIGSTAYTNCHFPHTCKTLLFKQN